MELLKALDLGKNLIEELAWDTKFYIIKPKKITATNLIQALLEVVDEATISYNKVAIKIHELVADGPSKQAVSKRINDSFLELLKSLFEIMLKNSCDDKAPFFALDKYDRVVIQDSTIITLPFKLYDEYSGVSNGHSAVCNARLQYAIDIKKMELIHFSIDTYSENDGLKAHELILREKDLSLRDKGYFSMSEIERQIEADADFILRHKANAIYRSIDTNKPFNLLRFLRKHKKIDRCFYLNNKNKTKVRVVAIPVPKEISKERKAKAKKVSCSKSKLRTNTLKLMEWDIYITNIEDILFETIRSMYRVRWWVEVIFKTLKSNFNLNNIHNVSKTQLHAIIYARLIASMLAQKFIYVPYSQTLKEECTVSMVKLFEMIKMNYSNILEHIKSAASGSLQRPNKNLIMVAKYCCYEKRKRKTFIDMLNHIKNNLAEAGS